MKIFTKLFIIFSMFVVLSGLFGAAGAVLLYYWGQQEYGHAQEQVLAPDDTGSATEDAMNIAEVSDSPLLYSLDTGKSLKSLSRDLYDLKVVSSPALFHLWVRVFSDFRTFKAGSYRFVPPIKPQELAEIFVAGETYAEPVLEITIPEGFTVRQVIKRFVEHGVGSESEFLRLSVSPSFLKSLDISASSIEGFLYPATYRFYQMPDEAAVFSQMVRVFWKRLPKGYEVHVAAHGVNLNQAITIASLIEAETPNDNEKNMVAEVIWSRLDRGMTLGIDASVIYGIEDYAGDLTRRHLEDRSNPYNLRVYQGLPPTPINSPSVNSLLSVLNASREGYLFYVVNPDQEKRHTFTKNLEAHNKEVQKLVAASRKAK